MNRNDLFKSFNGIDEELLRRSENVYTLGYKYLYIRIAVAVLAVIVCVFGISFLYDYENGQKKVSGLAMYVYAANGERNQMNLNELFLNSVPNSADGGYKFFDVDMPLFSFTFQSPLWEGQRLFHWDHTVSFSYNGHIVDGKDAHIVFFHIIPGKDQDGYCAYEILGWFEEPTDLVITVYDKESGKMLEETTVHICYFPEEEIYGLTVTEVKTYENK